MKIFKMVKFNKFTSIGLIALILAFHIGPLVPIAHATVTSSSDTMSRLKVSPGGGSRVLSDHAIQLTTSLGVTSGQTIVVTMPSDFDGTTDPDGTLDFSDVDLLEDTSPDGVCDGTAETLVASGASSSQWNAAFSATGSRTLTFTSGGASAIIAAASEICIKVGENAVGGSANSQYENPTSNGTKVITVVAGSESSQNITIIILTDDQVSVTATVDQSLTFTISDTTIGFGTLTASDDFYATGNLAGSATDTSAHTLVVGTNATSGYSMTVNGNTLRIGTSGPTITAIGATGATTSVGSEQFGLYMVESGGIGAVAAPYDDDSTPKFAFDTAAFPDQVASASGASANTTYNVHYLANIASNTDAGSYTATLTYVSTANF